MSISDSHLSAEVERELQQQLDEAAPQIEEAEREIAALFRQLPGWKEGLSQTGFLYPLLQREYGLSWDDLARLNPYTRKMYLEDLIRHAAATKTKPTPQPGATASHEQPAAESIDEQWTEQPANKHPIHKVAAKNVLRLAGAVWHVRYEKGDETGDFPDRPDSVLRRLVRLLAEPNRRISIQEFYPPPPGADSLPFLGRDESSDDQARTEYEEKLRKLAQEIKEADDAHDADTAAKLRDEFEVLADHLKGEQRTRGHKRKCGSLSPKEKADQALRVSLGRLYARFRTKGLAKLADHLDKYLDNSGGEWWYAPPPGTSPWQIED